LNFRNYTPAKPFEWRQSGARSCSTQRVMQRHSSSWGKTWCVVPAPHAPVPLSLPLCLPFVEAPAPVVCANGCLFLMFGLCGCVAQPFGGQDIEEVLQSMSSDDCLRVWDALVQHVASDFDAESQVTVAAAAGRCYENDGCGSLLTRDDSGRTLSTLLLPSVPLDVRT
jgi:hypothetical protein